MASDRNDRRRREAARAACKQRGRVDAVWRARADVAAHGSGEALSLPKHFWGGSQPPLSVVQRPASAGVVGGAIVVALYVCYNEFYENVT